MCPPVSVEALPTIVFIDFAFACQSLEDTVLPTTEVDVFADILKSENQLGLPCYLVDSLWLPPLEPEYHTRRTCERDAVCSESIRSQHILSRLPIIMILQLVPLINLHQLCIR